MVVWEVFNRNTGKTVELSRKTKSGQENWTSYQAVVIRLGLKLRTVGSITTSQRGWERQGWAVPMVSVGL